MPKPEKQLPIVQQISRPSHDKAAAQNGAVIVATVLAGNLGTAPEILQKLKIDERKMAYLNDYTLTSYNYLAYRGAIDKIRFWDWFVDYELAGSQGIDGRASRRILTALANSSGVTTVEKADKPNIIARSLWRRNWKEDAEKQGKIVEE